MIPSRVVALMIWVVAGCLQMLAAAPQSLRWLAPDRPVLVLGVPHTCRAEASSGLPVHFRVLSGPAVLEGDQLVVTNVDDVVLIAEQPGNGDFSPGSAIRSFNVYRVDLAPEPGFRFGSGVVDLVAAGDLAFALDRQGGVLISRVPVEGPVVPLARHRVTGRALALTASETHLFLWTSLGRLEAVDLRSPQRPASAGWLSLPIGVTHLTLQDGLLFAGAGPQGLAVVDVRDPARMSILSRYQVAFDPVSGSGVTQIVPAGNRLYLNVTAGLQIVDIADPTHPRWIGGFTRWGPNRIVGLGGHLAGMVHGGRLTVLDVRDPMKVQELGHHDFRDGRSTIANLRSVGDQLVLTDTSGALEVLSLRNPSSPRILGRHVDWFRNGALGSAPLAVLHEAGRVLITGSDGVIEPLRLTRRIPQELEWLQPASDALALHETHPLEAKASSGLRVEWSVVSGPAVIGPEGLKITGRGAVAVVARQPGSREVAPVELRRTFNPTVLAPQPLGRIPLDGVASHLLVTNRLAFVALDNAGVKVVDLNRPANPVLLSSISPIPYSRRMARIGDHLVVVGSEDLAVVDVRDPSQPVVRSRLRPGWLPVTVETVGSQVLVAAGGRGVQVMDLADPENPRVSGEIAIPGYTQLLEVRPPRAVIGHPPGVGLWDVRDPLAATRHSVLGGTDAFEINDVWVGETLLVAVANRRDSHGGFESSRLEVHGIHDPANPRLLGSTAIGKGWSGSVTVHESWAFVGTPGSEDSEHLVFDLRDPVQPRLAGRLPETTLMAAEEDLLVATTTARELVTYSWQEAMTQQLKWASPDVSVLDPGVVHPLRATASSGLPVEYTVLSGPAEIHDGVLSVTHDTQQKSIIIRATQSGGPGQLPGESVRVFNQRSVDLELLGRLEVPVASAVSVSGGYACVAGWVGPLLWVDVRDPRQPRQVASLNTGLGAPDVVISGEYAYAADFDGTLAVVDLRNPEAPTVVASLKVGEEARRVTVDGGYAFVAVRGRIQVVDVSDPRQPRLAGSHAMPFEFPARGLLARGGFLHVVDLFTGLTVLDVRDPAHPRVAGSLPSIPGSGALALEGPLLWVEDFSGGLSAVDISDPTHPRQIVAAETLLPGLNQAYKSMALLDGLVFCTGVDGVQAFEVANRDHLLTAGSHPLPPLGQLHGVAVSGDLAYVAAGPGGFLIFRIQRGIRSTIGPLDIPTRGEPGERIPLPERNRHAALLSYEVVSGPARVQEGMLMLEGTGQVRVKVVMVPGDRYLPAEALIPITVMPLVLHTVPGAPGEPTELHWRQATDVLETSVTPGGPWTPLPDARPSFRPKAGDSPRFFRVVRP